MFGIAEGVLVAVLLVILLFGWWSRRRNPNPENQKLLWPFILIVLLGMFVRSVILVTKFFSVPTPDLLLRGALEACVILYVTLLVRRWVNVFTFLPFLFVVWWGMSAINALFLVVPDPEASVGGWAASWLNPVEIIPLFFSPQNWTFVGETAVMIAASLALVRGPVRSRLLPSFASPRPASQTAA